MSNQRPARVWRRAGVLASMVALVGTVITPAVSATETEAAADEHCAYVVTAQLASGELITADPVCFPTLAEAIGYGTGGRVNLPAGTTGADLLALQALAQTTGLAIDPLAGDSPQAGGGPDNGGNGGNTAIHFKGYSGSGSSASVFNIYCTGGEWWSVSQSFDNRIRSTRNPCYQTKHYDGEGLTGASSSTFGQYSTVSLWSFPDRTNSVAYIP